MPRLNYKQLHQFWIVAKAGSIREAGEQLNLAPQTLSGQIAALEQSLGVMLFERVGRRLEITETGRMVASYADEMFEIGNELETVLSTGQSARSLTFRVGVAQVVPKSLAYQLLAPALKIPEQVRIVCREDKLSVLLAELALHRLDLVLTDRPLPSEAEVRAYSHKLGECGTTFLASPNLAQRYRKGFPSSLDDAPLLIPGAEAAVRPRLLRWLDAQRVRPQICGEFDDGALMKAFGAAGAGVFIAPTAVAAEVERIYGVERIGESADIQERYYAISTQRRFTHPALQAMSEAARTQLFA